MKYLTLYLKDGQTLRFESVSTVIHSNWDDRLSFDYKSGSTGAAQRAKFAVGDLMGYSHSLESEIEVTPPGVQA
jgi:hypothetical protein